MQIHFSPAKKTSWPVVSSFCSHLPNLVGRHHSNYSMVWHLQCHPTQNYCVVTLWGPVLWKYLLSHSPPNVFLNHTLLINTSNVDVIKWCKISMRPFPLNTASASISQRLHQKARNVVRRILGIVPLTFIQSWLPLYVLISRPVYMLHCNGKIAGAPSI